MRPEGIAGRSGPQARLSFERLVAIGAIALVDLVLGGLAYQARAAAPVLTLAAVVVDCAFVLHLAGANPVALVRRLDPRSLPGLAALVVALALSGAVVRLPTLLSDLKHSLDTPSYPLAEADLEPLSAWGSVPALIKAKRLIPPGATYTVLSGDLYKVPYLFEMWLVPRVFSWGIAGSSFVIDYQVPIPAGLRVARKLTLAPNIYLLELAR